MRVLLEDLFFIVVEVLAWGIVLGSLVLLAALLVSP